MGRLRECLKVITLLVVCSGVPVIAWELYRIIPHRSVDTPSPTSAELVAIILGAVTVVLAVLAIVIAILAVWGYQSIKSEAAGAADRAVKSTVESAVAKHVSDDRVKNLLRRELRRVSHAALKEEAAAYNEAFPATAEGQQGAVGTEYPKGDGNDGQTGS